MMSVFFCGVLHAVSAVAIAIIVKILVFIFKILSLLAQKVEQAATERLLVKKFLFDVVGVDN